MNFRLGEYVNLTVSHSNDKLHKSTDQMSRLRDSTDEYSLEIAGRAASCPPTVFVLFFSV